MRKAAQLSKKVTYGKQFKLAAAVKLAGDGASSASVMAKELGISMSSLRPWINNTTNMVKVRFQAMETHFLSAPMKL